MWVKLRSIGLSRTILQSMYRKATDTPMFADDIILLSASANGLNKQISTHEEFCSQWNLRINTENLKSVDLEQENITILNIP